MTSMDASVREHLQAELDELVAAIHLQDGDAFYDTATRIGIICDELQYPHDRLPGSLGRYYEITEG
jgi:hypothetical protein